MNLTTFIGVMADAGCSGEQIRAVIRAYEAEELEKAEAKRAKATERKRKSRAMRPVASITIAEPVTPCHALSRDVTPQKCDPPPPASLPDKERSPTPPKEINPLSTLPHHSDLRSVSFPSSKETHHQTDFFGETIDLNAAEKRPSAKRDAELEAQAMAVWDRWDSFAAQNSLPATRVQTDTRKRRLMGFCRELIELGYRIPLEGFELALAKVRASPFLRGDRGSTPVSFDWIIKPANFSKVIEGNYDERPPNQARTNGHAFGSA